MTHTPPAPASASASKFALARVELAYARIREVDRPEIWIHLVSEDAALAAADAVDDAVSDGAHLPLAGMVMAVKDNIDVAGLPTTAGCPEFSYVPETSAPAVQRLIDQGVVIIGKTNLDQFATGLVGTRSPHGAVRNALNPAWISGGSSSGSAVAVALGLVDAALGTDTAGSGRVPAAFNAIVGLKPTRGRVSARGVVPACRSLDCVSVLAPTVSAGWPVLSAMFEFDDEDLWARPEDMRVDQRLQARHGMPTIVGVADRSLLGLSPTFAARYDKWIASLASVDGISVMRFDPLPLREVGDLLYEGAFVAERAAAVGEFVLSHRDSVDPVVGQIIASASEIAAWRLFRDGDCLKALTRRAQHAIDGIDVLALPTAPTIYRIDEVMRDPLETNASLGRLNNFCNLLDYCAVTIPAGTTSSGEPFGVNLFSTAGHDHALAMFAAKLNSESDPTAISIRASSPTEPTVLLAVVGAHLTGQPLNHQLTSLNAHLVTTTTTSANYRLSALGTVPPKPGLWRVENGTGVNIELEVWELTVGAFGAFAAAIPPPLGIGSVELADGSLVRGFICEPYGLEGAPDISSFGGWRAYLASQ
jgi:allophanate hydrolase